MPVTSQTNYPSLGVIANLVRVLVNDSKKGATRTLGEGQILTNTSVELISLMNSAIRDTYRDVRISGQPTLIKDMYILSSLPPVNSNLGVGVPNPSVQTAVQFGGYFDGSLMDPLHPLPGDLLFPLDMWERQSNSPPNSNPYTPMSQSVGPLSARMQTQTLGEWEWRTDSIWLHGATLPVDIRLRYLAQYVDLVSSSIDWDNTYVPVMDSQECIADKIAVRYSARLGGDALADARVSAATSLLKLRQQVSRMRQQKDFIAPVYGSRGGSDSNLGGLLF